MRRIADRLTELKREYEEGQRMLADLEAKQASLQATLLRISGAIQVLEELLAGEPQGGVAGHEDAGQGGEPPHGQ